MKQCTKCKDWKIDSEFRKDNNKDGLRYWCKDCVLVYMRKRYKIDGKGLKKYYRYEECHRVVDGVKQKRCRKCKSWKTESEFYNKRSCKDGLQSRCKACGNKATNKSHKKRRTAVRN